MFLVAEFTNSKVVTGNFGTKEVTNLQWTKKQRAKKDEPQHPEPLRVSKTFRHLRPRSKKHLEPTKQEESPKKTAPTPRGIERPHSKLSKDSPPMNAPTVANQQEARVINLSRTTSPHPPTTKFPAKKITLPQHLATPPTLHHQSLLSTQTNHFR